MRKLLNTLYVTQPESYLSKDGQNIVVSINQKEIFRIPCINIENIVTFGYMGASPGLMRLCAENGIGLCFMTPNGKFISRISGPQKGNVTLRMRQYFTNQNEEQSVAVAQILISGKIHNCRQLLLRHLREYGQNEELKLAQSQLLNLQNKVKTASEIGSIMGIEGLAASIYYGVFNNFILSDERCFKFDGRSRRPPCDPMNVLLSFTYTLLTNEIVNALETVGLDPYVGFLHQIRPGRPSLALDLIEEFRATICDRFVLSLVNKRQVSSKHFQFSAENVVHITDEGRKILLGAWQNRKREKIRHPYLNEQLEYGLLPYVQSVLMARFLRKEIDGYPVYLVK